MNFLVDAQLPRRIVYRLREVEHDAVHTLDLPNGNRTTDTEINAISVHEQRIVVTKDEDFVNSFFLKHQPYKLHLISTGNIRNSDLEALLLAHLPPIVSALDVYDYLELSRSALIIRA